MYNRNTARPTAEIETRVPIQYLITSYFAASSCALNAWISYSRNKQEKRKSIHKNWVSSRKVYTNHYQTNQKKKKGLHSFYIISTREQTLTRSSLFVRFVVSAFWLASSSRMRLHNLKWPQPIIRELKNEQSNYSLADKDFSSLTLFQDLSPNVGRQ